MPKHKIKKLRNKHNVTPSKARESMKRNRPRLTPAQAESEMLDHSVRSTLRRLETQRSGIRGTARSPATKKPPPSNLRPAPPHTIDKGVTVITAGEAPPAVATNPSSTKQGGGVTVTTVPRPSPKPRESRVNLPSRPRSGSPGRRGTFFVDQQNFNGSQRYTEGHEIGKDLRRRK
jgi:hypothetical protein